MIVCRTLGALEIRLASSGETIELKGNKNRALFAYLARTPNHTRGREHLIWLLWADKPEEKARHSLREAVRVLRQQLGEAVVVSGPNMIGIAAEHVSLDVQEFDGLVSTAAWADASSYVHGEFLEDLTVKGAWAFEEWLASERAFWRGKSILALSARCGELLAEGRVDEAVDMSRRALALDPCSGMAIQATMKSLALAGDRTQALQHYESYLARLTEIASEPDAEAAVLAQRIKRERTWQLPPSIAEKPRKGAESRRVPLIGRASELSALVTEWQNCQSRTRAAVCLLEGDSGTGKTRLTEELLTRARMSRAAVAAFRAVPGDLDLQRTGILTLARAGLLDATGLAAASPHALSAFAAEIPEWADRFGMPRSQSIPLEAALVDVIRVACVEQPVLLLVDDAHWCDRTSLLSLTALARDLSVSPVMLVFAFSPQPPREELDDLRSRINRDLPGTCITLGALSESAIRELTRWAMPEYSEEEIDRLTRRIASDTAGLPLLAVELLHAVALGMDLSETTGAWPQPFRTLSHTLPAGLPDAIVGAIRVGFRRLTNEAQLLLAAAAVLDNPVASDGLSRGTGLADQKLLNALDELEWQRWLTADSRGYSFVARIVREVVARDMVTKGQRERLLKSAVA